MVSWLYSHHFMTLVGKPCSITPRSGTYIEHQKLGSWKKRKPVRMDRFRVDLLIPPYKTVRITVINRHR
jgi:hypothetical protein